MFDPWLLKEICGSSVLNTKLASNSVCLQFSAQHLEGNCFTRAVSVKATTSFDWTEVRIVVSSPKRWNRRKHGTADRNWCLMILWVYRYDQNNSSKYVFPGKVKIKCFVPLLNAILQYFLSCFDDLMPSRGRISHVSIYSWTDIVSVSTDKHCY